MNKQKKGFQRVAIIHESPLFQAFSGTLLPERTFSFCIKISRNIDPPYNTGSDFVYEDDFNEETSSFQRRDGQFDEQGNRLAPNLDSNGCFHTDWLNMLYPRLRIARDLLRDDGVIYISIEDNEVAQLRKICDEIFGTVNFEGHIHWRRRHNHPNDKTKMIGLVAEHIIA